MRAVRCTELGSLANVVVEEIEIPSPGPGQVLVSVKAAGVNFVDGLMCEGRYQIRFPTPYVPGGEIAGEVLSLGEGVSGFSVGVRVMALTGFGAFCESIAVPAVSLVRIPEALGF
jgi:NADPH:quinone reductase